MKKEIVQAYETLMLVPSTQVSTNMAEMEEAGNAELIQAQGYETQEMLASGRGDAWECFHP